MALELSESIRFLTEKTHALAAQIPVREALERAAEARRQQHQIAVDKNQEHLQFKYKADEILRHAQITSAHTLEVSVASGVGAAVITRSGVIAAQGAAVAIDSTLRAVVAEIGRIAAIRAGQTVSMFATAALYSPPLANGELTSVQRDRLFQGVAVNPGTLGLPLGVDLKSIADAGGTVPLNHRISIEATEQGTKVNIAQTGRIIATGVPVINAIADPQQNRYTAKLGGPLGSVRNPLKYRFL